MNLYLDIETVPRVTPTKNDLSAPGSYKKQESIDAYIKNNHDTLMAAEIKKRSLSLYDAKIVCISYAFDDSETKSLVGREDHIIANLSTAIEEHTSENGGSPEGVFIIGHNVRGFDAPMIWLRACLYDKHVLKSVFFPKRKMIIDTMELCAAGQYKLFVSLDTALKFFKIGNKGDVTGADVFKMYQEKRIEDISKYCCEDVDKVRKLHKKMDHYAIS
jgi:predicted PolB exonuclease-like 3'-5' exonuclease